MNKKTTGAVMILTMMISLTGPCGEIHGASRREETLVLTRQLSETEQSDPEEPEEVYLDPEGREYRLVQWRIEEKDGGRTGRHLEKQVVYQGVEGAEKLPEAITVSEERSGNPAEGKLILREMKPVNEEWSDSFCMPVIFHAYGAEEYELGELVISGENALEEAAAAGEELLETLGLSGEEYRITNMVWEGEPFADEGGLLCRRALAFGEKLLRDYEAVYEGDIWWQEPVSYELVMEYEPAELSEAAVRQAADSGGEAEEESPEETVPDRERDPLWYWVRSGFVITVAAGLLGIGLGLLILFIAWIRRRRKEREGIYLPQKPLPPGQETMEEM